MQFSQTILAIAASAATFAAASPIVEMVERANTTDTGAKTDVAQDGMSVAACETQVAAQQTACLATCSTAPCYAACGTAFSANYAACAALA